MPGTESEPAVFVTTRQDSERFPPGMLSDRYHPRWEEEESYKLLKELLAAENIRGQKCLQVHQQLIATTTVGRVFSTLPSGSRTRSPRPWPGDWGSPCALRTSLSPLGERMGLAAR